MIDERSLQSTLDLVDRNTSLKKLSIKWLIRIVQDETLKKLFRTLVGHPSIKELGLDGTGCHVDDFVILLNCLPQDLETLTLNWKIYADAQPICYVPRSRSLNNPTIYARLRSVIFDTTINVPYENILLTFLRRCPALEKIGVPQLSAAIVKKVGLYLSSIHLFPHLNALYLCPSQFYPDAIHRTPLVNALSNRLKSLSTGVFIPNKDNYVSCLIRAASPQMLEAFELNSHGYIPDSSVLIVLTEFPRLKSVRIWDMPWTPSGDARGHRENWKEVSGVNVTDEGCNLRPTQWACLDLEELELSYLDGRRIRRGGRKVEAKVLEDEERHTAIGIERAYQQLGRLTKLKKMRIGWCTTEAFSQGANLDMSLESGLRHLDGLKELRELDLMDIRFLKVGQEELQWMLASWPKLRIINGLIRKPKEGEQGVVAENDPDSAPDQQELVHIHWLRAHCPRMAIS